LTYTVELSKKAKKEFEKLPLAVQGRMLPKIIALPGSNDSYRIRDADYRALYTIHDDIVLVYVFRVEHRKDAYRGL
jgi:mRNA-degrading endonuclease RelE of RelBE toxin-antitoxin system